MNALPNPRWLEQSRANPYAWADAPVVNAVLQPQPAEAATEVGAHQQQRPTWLLRLARAWRARRLPKGPKL